MQIKLLMAHVTEEKMEENSNIHFEPIKKKIKKKTTLHVNW